jgi:hypothetical protein
MRLWNTGECLLIRDLTSDGITLFFVCFAIWLVKEQANGADRNGDSKHDVKKEDAGREKSGSRRSRSRDRRDRSSSRGSSRRKDRNRRRSSKSRSSKDRSLPRDKDRSRSRDRRDHHRSRDRSDRRRSRRSYSRSHSRSRDRIVRRRKKSYFDVRPPGVTEENAAAYAAQAILQQNMAALSGAVGPASFGPPPPPIAPPAHAIVPGVSECTSFICSDAHALCKTNGLTRIIFLFRCRLLFCLLKVLHASKELLAGEPR